MTRAEQKAKKAGEVFGSIVGLIIGFFILYGLPALLVGGVIKYIFL